MHFRTPGRHSFWFWKTGGRITFSAFEIGFRGGGLKLLIFYKNSRFSVKIARGGCWLRVFLKLKSGGMDFLLSDKGSKDFFVPKKWGKGGKEIL